MIAKYTKIVTQILKWHVPCDGDIYKTNCVKKMGQNTHPRNLHPPITSNIPHATVPNNRVEPQCGPLARAQSPEHTLSVNKKRAALPLVLRPRRRWAWYTEAQQQPSMHAAVKTWNWDTGRWDLPQMWLQLPQQSISRPAIHWPRPLLLSQQRWLLVKTKWEIHYTATHTWLPNWQQ